jgi:ElaB/YqjD/DUF883 family membrane-anchored ribosome-binding protein
MASTANDQNREDTVSHRASEAARHAASTAADYGHGAAQHYVREPARDLISLAKEYAKDHPDVAACWAFGLGVVVGWKLKP